MRAMDVGEDASGIPTQFPKAYRTPPPAFKKCLKIPERESLLNWHAFVLTGTRVVLDNACSRGKPWMDGMERNLNGHYVLRHNGINTAAKRRHFNFTSFKGRRSSRVPVYVQVIVLDDKKSQPLGHGKKISPFV